MLRRGNFPKKLPISQIPAKCNEILLRSGKVCQMMCQVSPFLSLICQFLPHLSSKTEYQRMVTVFTFSGNVDKQYGVKCIFRYKYFTDQEICFINTDVILKVIHGFLSN